MKKLICSLLACATIGMASTVTLTYENPGSPGIIDSKNDYVGPYTLSENGTWIAAMCMNDYYFVHGTWTANVTAVNGTNFSNTYLGNNSYTIGGSSYTSAQIYDAEAYLYSQLIEPGADRIDLQDAAWTLMDDATGHAPHSTSTAVTNILAGLPTDLLTFNASGYEILTQVNPGDSPEQEYITATPEPAALPLMAIGLLCAGLFFGAKSRRASAVNA